MSNCEKSILTVLCMIYQNDKILLQNRVKEDWKGYTFPGGHVEKQEAFVQAAIREMKEETGLTVKSLHLCGVKQFQTDADERYIVLLFKTNCFEGNLSASDEGEMVWIDRSRLGEYPLVDDFMELLEVFDSPDLNEFMYEHRPGTDEWPVKLY